MLNLNATLIVQLVNFIVFLAILNVIFFRPVGAAIAKRRAYLDGLAQAGFCLERVVEEHTPGRPQDAGGVPGLLYARARRCEGRAPKS